jgi:hypothetical protein
MNAFWSTFFPNDILSLAFVAVLILWFVIWLRRLSTEAAHLDFVRKMLNSLDACITPLQRQQLWRDRQRLQGLDMGPDPAFFFDEILKRTLANAGTPPVSLQIHFRAIFVAGCEESLLDSVELNSQTCRAIGVKSEQYRYELLVIFLLGALGTLLGLSGHSADYVNRSALPPLIWGVLLAVTGGLLYLHYHQQKLVPALADLRQKTTTLWIPRLYPTVAQRAAQWAMHTLHNAARITDASDVIEKHAVRFVGAVENARHAAETFSGGMKEFSRGMEISDRALQNAQSRLAGEVEKFADCLQRWGQFEGEIRRFYGAVEGHQKQLVQEHKGFEAMLAGYYDFIRQSTAGLQTAASEVNSVASTLPQAFQNSAQVMTRSVSESQADLAAIIADLGNVIRSAYQEESSQVRADLTSVVDPVLRMEDRLRALSTPFEAAAHNLVEIAQNLLRLNENFQREVSRSLQTRAVK